MKKVFVIQSALPAMTQTTLMARLYGADTEYAAVLVSTTTIAALFAIPVYMLLI
jgi:malate permease and related proteins